MTKESDVGRQKLAGELASLPIGIIPNPHRQIILDALRATWSGLSGGGDQATTPDKVYRAEELEWNPPTLKFILERHGGTVNGSSRAELHHWEVDTVGWSASIVRRGHRQLVPQARAIRIDPICRELLASVTERKEHVCVHWIDSSRARFYITRAFPDGAPQQTMQGRTKRLREMLPTYLESAGWALQRVGSQYFIVRKD